MTFNGLTELQVANLFVNLFGISILSGFLLGFLLRGINFIMPKKK